MNQENIFEPVYLDPSTAHIDVNTFKRVLLDIILTFSFIEGYNADLRKTKIPATPGKKASTQRIRGGTRLRTLIGLYNTRVRKTKNNRAARNKGSIDKLNTANDKRLSKKRSALITVFNQLNTAPLSDDLYGEVANVLDKGVAPGLTPAIDVINAFAYCQHLLYEAFPYFDPFGARFVCSDPAKQPYSSVDALRQDGQTLSHCLITFRQDAPKPASEFPPHPQKSPKLPPTDEPDATGSRPDQIAQTISDTPRQQAAIALPELPPPDNSEFYLAHYLTIDHKPLLASVILDWKNDQLDRVRLQQLEDMFVGLSLRVGLLGFLG